MNLEASGDLHTSTDQVWEPDIDATVAAVEPIKEVMLSRCLLRGDSWNGEFVTEDTAQHVLDPI